MSFAAVAIVAVDNQDWDQADRSTKRLAPAAFVGIPLAVRSELQHRGCTVPQPFTANAPSNAITGRFTSTRRTDWAVLCSRQRVSSIIVFPGGAASGAVEIATEPDSTYLQTIDGNETVGYSRAIDVADAKYIREHYVSYGGPKPPPLDHEGINDIFIEKGSVVWYWHQGRWLRLQGAD
jgi:hypothetical protein